MSYGFEAAGLATTFGGIYSLEGNIGNHALEARNKSIIGFGLSMGVFTGLLAGQLGKNYEIRHRERFRLKLGGEAGVGDG